MQDSIDRGRATEEKGPNASRNALQIVTLLDALEEFQFSAAIGGARRDEEKARAKERFFSHRNEFGQWDPKNQRPELWNLFNGKMHIGEHFRVFPLSNWTEMDVWQYIKLEELALPSIYFSHEREVVERQGLYLAHSPYLTLAEDEKIERKVVRCRTVGDMTCMESWPHRQKMWTTLLPRLPQLVSPNVEDAPMTSAPRRRWKIERRMGISKAYDPSLSTHTIYF